MTSVLPADLTESALTTALDGFRAVVGEEHEEAGHLASVDEHMDAALRDEGGIIVQHRPGLLPDERDIRRIGGLDDRVDGGEIVRSCEADVGHRRHQAPCRPALPPQQAA